MSHPYEIRVVEFMKRIGASPQEMEEKLLKPAEKDVGHYLRKLYEDDPNRPFSIRMSNIGKPLCQLQMDKAKAKKIDNDWNFPLRMMYGGIVEGLAVAILKHSGINVQEEQTPVILKCSNIEINGTLDLVIDGKVWDVKSASSYSYKEKFADYESLKEEDHFGYLVQLYGYAKARGLPPGGWVVVDKSSGEMKFIEVPDNWEEEQAEAINTVEYNAEVLLDGGEFERKFTDKDEYFRKKLTGNKVLDITCTFCPFRYSCWPNLQYLPKPFSTAYEKPYAYYTQYINDGSV